MTNTSRNLRFGVISVNSEEEKFKTLASLTQELTGPEMNNLGAKVSCGFWVLVNRKAGSSLLFRRTVAMT